jgi:hypothetical protein
LKASGCIKIEYLGLKKWIPLSRKYKLLADNCSETSKIYCGCAADLYPPPKRLKTQYDFFKEAPELDWTASGRTIFYDIMSEKTFLHDVIAKGVRKNDGSNRAIRMEIMRNLPVENRRSGVDGWMWRRAQSYLKSTGKKFKSILDESDNWKYGLNTQGLNNISHHRALWFQHKSSRPAGIFDCPIDINKTIPQDVMDKLRGCKKHVKFHKKAF